MDPEIEEKYVKAGRIASRALKMGSEMIVSGARYLEVADSIESFILKNGGELAFPVNIAVNEIAAHYSPVHNDKLLFKDGDMVKLDVGSHVDGFIADTAVTIEVDSKK